MSKDRRKEDLAEHGGWYLKKTDVFKSCVKKCLKAVFLHKHTYIYIGWDEWGEVNYRPRTFLYFGVGNRRGESKERRWNVRVTERWVWWQRVSEGVKDEKVLWKGELVDRNKVQPSIQILFFSPTTGLYHRLPTPCHHFPPHTYLGLLFKAQETHPPTVCLSRLDEVIHVSRAWTLSEHWGNELSGLIGTTLGTSRPQQSLTGSIDLPWVCVWVWSVLIKPRPTTPPSHSDCSASICWTVTSWLGLTTAILAKVGFLF